jgi:hypothetical protein
VLLTIRAQTVKYDTVPIYFKTGLPGDPGVDRGVYRFIQVEDLAAPVAAEMIMIGGTTIKTGGVGSSMHLQDIARLFQQPQVAINGSQSDIGDLLFHLFVYPFRGGMKISLLQDADNSFTLFGSFTHIISLI